MAMEKVAPRSVSVGNRQRFAAAYRVLEEAIRSRAFPGCAFGLLAGEQVVLEDALGRFTYESDAPPVTPGTVYDLASVTKVMATTAAAMLLHQRGRLDVDTPLGDLLPEFTAGRTADDPALRVTLRHLLAHSSGLPGYVKFFETSFTPESVLLECLKLKLEAEPGTRAEYSDPGFILLGKALEAVMQESLPAWTRREIFEPLGLKATLFSPPEKLRPAIPPTEEDVSFRKQRIQGQVQDENAWVLGGAAGHAGLFSNVQDVLRFAREIVNAIGGATGRAEQQRLCLFEPLTVERFAKRQEPVGSSRALGWDTPSERSTSGRFFSSHSIGHLGYSGCSLWIDLDARIAVTLLSNRTWPDRTGQLIREVRPAFHNALREAL